MRIIEKNNDSTLYIITHNDLINADCGARQRIFQMFNSKLHNRKDFLVPADINISLLPVHNKLLKFKELFIFSKSTWLFTDFNPFFLVKVIKILLSQRYDEIFIDFPRGFFLPWLLKRNAKLIYSSHGFEYEFCKLHLKNAPKILHKYLVGYLRLQERIVCKISDEIICINERDLNNYISKYKLNEKKLKYLAFKKINQYKTNMKKNEVRRIYGFNVEDYIAVFHGSWGHPANRESFEFIENKIAKQLQGVKFVFAGMGMERAQHDNVYKLGYLENIEELLIMADFAICPIFSGSGTNIKIYDYINYNLKIVVSPRAKESLPPDYHNYVLCENTDEYINAIRLLSNMELMCKTD